MESRTVAALSRAVACLCLTSQACTALAQTDLTELSLEQLLNIDIVSASHFTQKASDAPSAVTIIRSNEIRQYGWRNLAEVLNSVRGFNTTYDRYFHHAGIRGFQPPGDYNSRLLLMVDGYRVNDNVFDQASLGNEFVLDLDLVDHIEIVRGPGSPVYGGNAFFGAINVITRRGKDMANGEIATSVGSFDTYTGRATLGKVLGNGMDMVLSYSGLHSGGQNLYFPEFNSPATNNGWTSGTDKETSNKLFAKLGLGGLQLETAWSRRLKGDPSGAFGTVFNNPGSNISDEYGTVDVRYTERVGSGLEFTGRTFYGSYNYAGNFVFDYPPLVTNQDMAYSRWWGAEAKLVATRWQGHQGVLGLDYQRDTRQDQVNFDAAAGTGCYAIASAAPCLDSRASGYRLGLFAQDDIALRDTLTFSAGLRFDRSNIAQDRINPRLGLIYKPYPASVLKLLYGSAFRTPNAYELHYAFPAAPVQIGNPTLKPETIQTTEVVWEQYLGSDTRLQASAYYYRIKDWIVQVSTLAGALQFQNQPEVSGKGIELEGEQRFAGGAQLRASLAGQFVPDHPNGALNSAPRSLAKANYSTPLFGSNTWRSGIEVQYVDRRATPSSRIGSYTLANATILWQARTNGPELSFSAYNLFDKRYQEVFPVTSLSNGVPRETIAQDGRAWRLKYLYRF